MTFDDAYPSFREHSLTGNWGFRNHKRWFGLLPDVLVLEVQVIGWEDEDCHSFIDSHRVLHWRDATRRDIVALGLIPSNPHG